MNLSPVIEDAEAANLLNEAQDFALDLMGLLAEIVPTGNLGMTCEAAVRNGAGLFAVASANEGGIVLTINREPRLQLQIDYKLILSPNSNRATVLTSNFVVRPYGVSRPLFTVDYVRNSGRNTPSAHYNFHFHQDQVTFQLINAGNARRGKVHRQAAENGTTPRLADLHFPLGGHRFRPCLEDVLEFLRIEFGIDVLESSTNAIRRGRQKWRRFQLRAAVSDDPVGAVEELRQLGYSIEWRGDGSEPDLRAERLQAI